MAYLFFFLTVSSNEQKSLFLVKSNLSFFQSSDCFCILRKCCLSPNHGSSFLDSLLKHYDFNLYIYISDPLQINNCVQCELGVNFFHIWIMQLFQCPLLKRLLSPLNCLYWYGWIYATILLFIFCLFLWLICSSICPFMPAFGWITYILEFHFNLSMAV